MQRFPHRAIALLLIASGGCAPSLAELAAGHHDRELVCAAQDGSTSLRARAADALEHDAHPVARVVAISAERLRELLGPAAEKVDARAALLRVEMQTDRIPVDRVELGARVVDAKGQPAAAPAGWEALAWATGEPLPRGGTAASYANGGNALRLLAAVGTLGMSLLFEPFRKEQVEVPPSPTEYQRTAPLAYRLHDALGDAGCVSLALLGAATAGQRCIAYFVIDRGQPPPAELEITARYTAARRTHEVSQPGEDTTCHAASVTAIPLALE